MVIRAGADMSNPRVETFATDLRDAYGIAICPTGPIRNGSRSANTAITSVKKAAFYGWPWYYIGDDEDTWPSGGQRPDRAEMVTITDVLIQPHSAPA